ncbi:MAG: AraC family transcriptional regulator [Cyclobacteriaceae bacterium]|nr:AraC family transcriptional regulator [Cyclobacteriaceae bacterium]
MAYRIDLFSMFIFLGIVQAIFLSVFFLSGNNRSIQANLFYGGFLVAVAACSLEIFLMYTDYIIHVLHLVDFSETFGLLIGPFLYLYILSMLRGRISKPKAWLHLYFPVAYFITHIPFLISSADVKYNAWLGAYHPNLPYREVSQTFDPWIFWLSDWHTELVLVSLIFYLILSGRVIIRAFREKKESFIRPKSETLITLRNGVAQIALFTLLIVVVKLLNEDDTGDHLFAAFGSLIIYATSISVMRGSGFFKQASLSEQQKYKSSSLTQEQQQILIDKLQYLMKAEKPFLRADFSQPDLAQKLGVSVHVLSQAINDGLGKSFFELMAFYRVEEAKKILIDQINIKVEEIAEQVGYNSKSSFNTVFKKFTGMTPSEFRSKNSD